ncbi:MAG: hypothetical protein RBG13Loki_1527 [Promethearchaeota archaeon CR_4]|nr:MAG: hypothetical protein RBG13Loki_1527 [Candidatus Lokiarchaeota archaeon CR_4]
MSEYNPFEMISEEDRSRLALILQGGKSRFGTPITLLKFSTDPVDRQREVNKFLEKVNRQFRNIFYVVQHHDLLVPIPPNSDYIGNVRNAWGSKALRLAIVILLHKMYNTNGPTEANLEEKLKGTKFTVKEIQTGIKELEDLCLVERMNVENIVFLNPTPVLYACISVDLLKSIFSKAFANDPQNDTFFRYLPREYIDIQRKTRFRSLDSFRRPKPQGEIP